MKFFITDFIAVRDTRTRLDAVIHTCNEKYYE